MNNIQNLRTRIEFNKLTLVEQAIAFQCHFSIHINRILKDASLFDSIRNVVIPPTQAQLHRIQVIEGLARTRYLSRKLREANLHSVNNRGN